MKCRAAKFDRSCRIVAQCSLDDSKGGDIGGAMIAAGMAYGFSLDETLPWEAARQPALCHGGSRGPKAATRALAGVAGRKVGEARMVVAALPLPRRQPHRRHVAVAEVEGFDR